jgi:cytochrome P450
MLPGGPSTAPLLQALRFGAAPYDFLERCRRDHGDVFTLRFPGGGPFVVLADPAMVRAALQLGPDDFRASTPGMHLNLGATSVLFQDGERHRRLRGVLLRALHAERLEVYAAVIARLCDARIDRWTAGARLSLHREMQELTLDVILECVFGATDEAARTRLRRPILRWLDRVMSAPLFLASLFFTGTRLRNLLDEATAGAGLPAALLRPLVSGKRALLEELRAGLATCRRDGTHDRNDVFAVLVDARHDDGSPLTDQEILDQVVTLLVAGHETTATTICWAMYYLLSHEDVRERAASARDWLEASIQESMRLAPIAVAVPRVLTRPFAAGPYEIAAGTMIWPCAYLVQRHERAWSAVDRFDPERFLGERPPAHAHMPFGGGRRRCLGAAFAENEMRIVIERLLARTRLRLCAPERERPAMRGFTVAPAAGLEVQVESVR